MMWFPHMTPPLAIPFHHGLSLGVIAVNCHLFLCVSFGPHLPTNTLHLFVPFPDFYAESMPWFFSQDNVVSTPRLRSFTTLVVHGRMIAFNRNLNTWNLVVSYKVRWVDSTVIHTQVRYVFTPRLMVPTTIFVYGLRMILHNLQQLSPSTLTPINLIHH